ncbi:hypothetical protein DH2020_033546 [Rehmannia glutinosa]|uniref:Receptor-like serine/threonine-protein kinase n=1 Tax=Rehmannia glutinosa TaxID=99300 RepID=A0ABR0VCB8_REHGL
MADLPRQLLETLPRLLLFNFKIGRINKKGISRKISSLNIDYDKRRRKTSSSSRSLKSLRQISVTADTINVTQSIRDGETLVSSGGIFEMGFFSPGNSSNRYVGLWYNNLTIRTIVWVANREIPLTNTDGILRVINPGLLVLLNNTNGGTIWSSNASRSVHNPVAQLLDYGNIVVRDANDENPENFLWQSFDYPTDTYLPGMRCGRNLQTGLENYLSAWRSNDDPSPGEYSFHLDPTGFPQILLKRDESVQLRIGPWNGIRFSGTPDGREDPTHRLVFVMNENEVSYREETIDRSVITRFTINPSGLAQRWTWVDRRHGWVVYLNMPADICDSYGLCGPYGSCNIGNSPSCGCLERFVPRDPEGWVRADWSNGCVRRSNLSCQGDVFLRYSGIKLPDATYSWYNTSMSLEECRTECLRNCSCTAYAQLDRSKGNGCLIWFDDLVDIRSLSTDGQDIYIRMASSEAGSTRKNRDILIASLTSAMGAILIGLSLFLCIRNARKMKKEETFNGSHDKDSELPSFHLSVILKATDHFSIINKLGEGGFGPVYKGTLEEGQEIAVKRLSKDSMQGLHEFKNEVIFIAKLQHRNLVRLLGCCIQGEENLLIYEFMPNKSLDVILFGNGYMSPEYAVDGLFSVKSDVFSFGVLMLEIVSGRRNRGFCHSDSNLNLLGHAWTVHREGRSKDLIDPCLGDSYYFSEVLRSIHVGLLCVQKNPEDRPSMSSVVLMLGNEGELPEAKQPGFFTERDIVDARSSTSTNVPNSTNEITITMPEPR